MKSSLPSTGWRARLSGFGFVCLLLWAILSVLLYGAYIPGLTLFSNDGPLGRLMAECHRCPARFTGCWNDLNVVGYREGSAFANISFALQWFLQPVGFSKFYALFALAFLGVGAWYFFRRQGLSSAACILGGLAASLNSAFFSAASWGVAGQAITFGLSFFAMGAVSGKSAWPMWVRLLGAGLAVGLGVAEGADIGALFSLMVGAFMLYQAFVAEGSRLKNLSFATGKVALVAVCAGLVAAQAITELVANNIEGVTGTQQDVQTRAERWDWATWWSLPKKEVFGFVVPGLFGYRGDTPGAASYWGTIGRNSSWDTYAANGYQGPQPKGFPRFSGGGYYAGIIVVLLGLWAALQALRRKDSAFDNSQRKALWFWSGLMVLSLLLGFGRHAPFYRWFYALPYVSVVRNPIKFLYLLEFGLVVLFGYAVEGLRRKYFHPSPEARFLPSQSWKNWFQRASRFEKNWLLGCAAALAASLVAWMIYASYRQSLEAYLPTIQVPQNVAHDVAGFSIRQVGWSVLFFALSLAVMAMIFRGAFTRDTAKWGPILLGALLVVDLGWANQPWIVYWDYLDKYASNPVVDLFRDKPYEQRVIDVPFSPPQELSAQDRLYRAEWIQHIFPFYNIQSLDIVQLPRVPEDISAFEKKYRPEQSTNFWRIGRGWQLTNTRYVMGIADYQQQLNQMVDPVKQRLRLVRRFQVVLKPGITRPTKTGDLTAELAPDGKFAVFEFSGTLPRARLYSHWTTVTNNADALDRIFAESFDPEQAVVVAGQVPAPTADPNSNSNSGQVQFESYAPKDVVMRSASPVASVLLFNDRFAPYWNVQVDGKPDTILRCNYLMRGVYLPPGTHRIEFRFQPPSTFLYVSLAAIGACVLVLGVAGITVLKKLDSAPSPMPASLASKQQQNQRREGKRSRSEPEPQPLSEPKRG